MKTALTIVATVLATAVAVSGWTAYLTRPATVHTVTRTKTVAVTVTSTPKPVTRWRTRTITEPREASRVSKKMGMSGSRAAPDPVSREPPAPSPQSLPVLPGSSR